MTRIYVHSEGRREPEIADVPGSTTLADLIDSAAGVVVLAEDGDIEFDLDLSIEEAGLKDRGHVYAGRRAKIAVEVNFNGDVREHEFSASTRVERVFKWAVGKQAFDLSKEDAAEHTLSICATGEVPPRDVHLGALDGETPGRVCFNLIPKQRFEG